MNTSAWLLLFVNTTIRLWQHMYTHVPYRTINLVEQDRLGRRGLSVRDWGAMLFKSRVVSVIETKLCFHPGPCWLPWVFEGMLVHWMWPKCVNVRGGHAICQKGLCSLLYLANLIFLNAYSLLSYCWFTCLPAPLPHLNCCPTRLSPLSIHSSHSLAVKPCVTDN